jgi:hypothetical protein
MMAEQPKTPDYGKMFNDALGTAKNELYAHRVRKSDAVVDMYAKIGKLSKKSGHDEIMNAVLGGADAYNKTLKELSGDAGKTAAKYTKGEMLTVLRQYGLDEETIVDAVKAGKADEIMIRIQQIFDRHYTGHIKHAIHREYFAKEVPGADRYTVEKNLAGQLKSKTGNSAPVEKIMRNLETMLLEEAERQLDLAPPAKKAA